MPKLSDTDRINLARKALKRADADREAAMAEYHRLYERFERRLERQLNQPRPWLSGRPTTDPLADNFSEMIKMEREKGKSGRPGIWRGLAGFLLVKAVEEIQWANERYSVARAIRKAIKTDPVLKGYKPIHRISDRALQARFQQAADYWSDARTDAIRRDLDAAHERVTEAIHTANTLRDVVDFLEGTFCNKK
jgi:hypothetical protein